MTSSSALPTHPIAGVTIPSTPLTQSALAHIRTKNLPSTVNHCLRSAIFALIATSKHPLLAAANINTEALVVAILLHDLGLSTSPDCCSADKRFEIDGAIAAQTWLEDTRNLMAGGGGGTKEAAQRIDPPTKTSIFYAIALHTTPTISLHVPDPLVIATQLGIAADFLGPSLPGGLITETEFKDVLRAYPRIGFKADMLGIMCGLCKGKPETTYDNFVGEVGEVYLEEEGGVREGYREERKGVGFLGRVWGVFEGNERFEVEVEAEGGE